jgi:hypothetical protein
MFSQLGSADVLLSHGFVKEASALYADAFVKVAMSPEEIVALVQQLPPGVQQEIIKQLEQHAVASDAVAPEGASAPEAAPEGAKTASEAEGYWEDIKGGNLHALRRGLTNHPNRELKTYGVGLLGALPMAPLASMIAHVY